MNVTEFFKGQEHKRNEFVVLYDQVGFYTAYGSDAKNISDCTGIVTTHNEEKNTICVDIPKHIAFTSCASWEGNISQILHNFYIVIVDKADNEVLNYYTTKLDDGYRLINTHEVCFHTGSFMIRGISWSQYYNGLRVNAYGFNTWAFVVCGRNNKGYHYLDVVKMLDMTPECAKGYRDGLLKGARMFRVSSYVRTYVLMNNNEYMPVDGENPWVPTPMDLVPSNFIIDPDDDKQLTATGDFGSHAGAYARLD